MANAPFRDTRLQVFTNSFKLNFARAPAPYIHYDVINPPLDKSRRAFEIIDELQVTNAQFFNPRAVYDGKANMFSKVVIPDGVYDVHMSKKNPEKGLFKVKLTKVATIRPETIESLMQPGGVHERTNLMAINLLQIVVRQATNMRHGFARDARAFYIAKGAKDLSGGLQAWHGYFQSVRPVRGSLLVNIDVVNALMYQPGQLTTLAQLYLGRRNVRDLERLPPQEINRLRSFLKNVNIAIKTSRNQRGRPIRDLVSDAGAYVFEKDGVQTTVQEHYRQAHNIQLQYPSLFGVRIGRDAIIPAEMCNVLPGQLYKKRIPIEIAPDFLKFSTQKPDARLRAIQDAVSGRDQVFDYEASDFVREAGVKVVPSPLSISGRVLPTPKILYGENRSEQIPARKGAWNVMHKKLFKPEPIPTWVVVAFENRTSEQTVDAFVGKLCTNLQNLGINVVSGPARSMGNMYKPQESLDDAFQRGIVPVANPRPGGPTRHYPAIVLALLPNNAPELRRAVKYWGDVHRGVPTQCVRAGKWESAKDQYCNNVALKINAKIGGINSKVDSSKLVPEATMVIGMDVGHPGPGVATRPSVTSLVASVDWDCTRYVAFCGVQEPRVEMISNLDSMLTDAMTQFALFWKGKYPARIIFFRDGVSEGEFEKVANEEIATIKEILLNMVQIDPEGKPIQSGRKAYPPEGLPKITFIVVGKRHHIRFFPANGSPQETDPSGNCPPGFVVDDQITNAKYPDFYLQSHSGIQGTSRPSHYIVLHNEIGLKPDDYQRLSYNLCHVYASATRSVSIPAPVYYADRVCARAENHFPEAMRFGDSDTASVAGAKQVFDLGRWEDGFQPAKRNMQRQMYFL